MGYYKKKLFSPQLVNHQRKGGENAKDGPKAMWIVRSMSLDSECDDKLIKVHLYLLKRRYPKLNAIHDMK
jgi:hypothetical protein